MISKNIAQMIRLGKVKGKKCLTKCFFYAKIILENEIKIKKRHMKHLLPFFIRKNEEKVGFGWRFFNRTPEFDKKQNEEVKTVFIKSKKTYELWPY